MLLDNFRSLHLDFAYEEPPVNNGDDDDDINNRDRDLHQFWEKNARHHRPTDRMYFDSWDLPDQQEQEPPPSSSNQIDLQVGLHTL